VRITAPAEGRYKFLNARSKLPILRSQAKVKMIERHLWVRL
jgi:hypothetical protein